MALEIIEKNHDATELVLLGIKGSGTVIAARIATYLSGKFDGNVIVAGLELDKKHPTTVQISPDIDFNGKVVILVDDVANSGRTMLYALQPLLKSFPKQIHTAALVERTHKSFPIALDYVGLSISTTLDEHIFVEVEDGEVLGAWVEVS